MKKIFLILLFNSFSFISIQAYAARDLAAELKLAQKDLSAGHFDSAYEQYVKFAKQGNALAQFTTAMFHQLGWGSIAIDPIKACSWHEKAASGAIPASTHFFAECLEKGTGRPPNSKEAARWYEKAAGLGHFMSLCSLADLYMTGNGVNKDPLKGLQLCQQAAQKGAVPAQLKIAMYLLEGEQSIRNPAMAINWLEKSARNYPQANYILGTVHDTANGVPADKSKALFWYEKAASLGYVTAYFPTAKLYFQSFPNSEQGLPSAEILAKTYMWLAASKQTVANKPETEEVNKMLDRVLAIMPNTWLSKLDLQVKEHFKTYPVIK